MSAMPCYLAEIELLEVEVHWHSRSGGGGPALPPRSNILYFVGDCHNDILTILSLLEAII